MNSPTKQHKFQKEYDFGFSLGDKGFLDEYEAKFGTVAAGYDTPWAAYLEGRADKSQKIYNNKFKKLKLDEFQQELQALCEKYSVTLDLGECEYGHRAYCGDFGFSMMIPRKEP